MKFLIRHIKEDSWLGRPKEEITWECDSEEDFFLKLLQANNHFQKSYKTGKKESYEIIDYDLADKYDEWWCSLSQEQKDEIYSKS